MARSSTYQLSVSRGSSSTNLLVLSVNARPKPSNTMKIVPRSVIASAKPGTVYSHYDPNSRRASGISVKVENCGDDDWFAVEHIGGGYTPPKKMKIGESFTPIDSDSSTRVGWESPDTLYAIWEAADISRLANLIGRK